MGKGGTKALTQQEFEDKSNVHYEEGHYDYSMAVYVRNNIYVLIGCNYCEVVFAQMPYDHMRGRGHDECAGNVKRTNEKVIKETDEKFGEGRYTFPGLDYKINRVNIAILCMICNNLFNQTFINFIRGTGCPECYRKSLSKPPDVFVAQCERMFQDKYDFSKCVYVNVDTDIILIEKATGKEVIIAPKKLFDKKCHSCGASSCYINKKGKEHACKNHFKEGMVKEYYICITEGCTSRRNTVYGYGKYCAYCFHNLFPDHELSKDYKTKEKEVVKFVDDKFSSIVDLIFNKTMQGGCFRRLPDILIDMGTHGIGIENDENQHKKYDTTCENKRDCQIAMNMGNCVNVKEGHDDESNEWIGTIKPLVLIRFNPDGYKIDGKRTVGCWRPTSNGMTIVDKTKWNDRLEKLGNRIQYWIDHVPAKAITRDFLFYDDKEEEYEQGIVRDEFLKTNNTIEINVSVVGIMKALANDMAEFLSIDLDKDVDKIRESLCKYFK